MADAKEKQVRIKGKTFRFSGMATSKKIVSGEVAFEWDMKKVAKSTETPAVKAKSERKKVGGSPYPEGTELTKGGKTYIVKDGKVLV